ncbi:hypothetical protein [Azospirillum sp. B21]|uniref:hypothetical protein n=1 Tax=Azospirillum sp. B21 TaxID=2607496 RepID=UPI001B3C0FBD|nr:hypothetical protein [Azospirillum sp. B21]
MANGGNVATAAGMQLGQLLGSLGPLGAALGAVVNVGGVMIGALQKAGGTAVDTTTSFNDYAKALEFAKKASEGLRDASNGARAALEAESRSAVDAAQKRLSVAEAELKSIEAGLLSTSDAAAASGAAMVYLFKADKVKELRQEIEVLRGTLGQYNDGARETRVRTEQGNSKLRDARNAIEEYREGLREQITELGVEVSTFDKSSAAKLRAKLEMEALSKAHAAGRTQIDAGTQSLINQAVARQEQIDQLEDQKKAQEEATRAAEQDAAEAERRAEQRQKTIDQADKYVDRLKGEAAALSQSERERFVSNKALEFELQYRGKLSGAEMDAYLSKVKQEAGALYDSTEARKAKAKADEEAVRELEKYQQDVARVATDIGKDISENLWDQITGEAKAGDALDFFKNWAKRLAVEMLNQNIVLPITMQLVGSMPSLFGIQSPGGSAANQNGGGMGNMLSLGSKFMPSSWTSGITGAIDSFGYSALGIGAPATMLAGQTVLTPSASVLASQTAMLQAANPGLAVTAAPTVTAGSSGGAAGGVAAGTGLSAYLGAAGIGFGVGSMLPSLLNVQNKGMGALVGAGGGAAAGALAGTFLFPGVGTVLGAIIGGAGGGLGGLIGTQKPSVGKTASADVTINSGGRSATYGNILTDNEGDAEAGRALGQYISSIFTTAAAGGGTLAKNFGFGQTAKDGYYIAGSVDYKKFGDDFAGMVRYALLDQGGLVGGGTNTLAALRNSTNKDAEEFGKDVALGASIDAGNTALREFDKSLNGVTKSAKETTAESLAPMFEELERAKKLGIDKAYVQLASDQLVSYLDTLRNPVAYTEVETAVASMKGQFQAMREAAERLNPAIVATVNAIEKETTARMAADLRGSLDQQIRETGGRGYINTIQGFIKTLDGNARSLLAVGEPVNRAQDLFNVSLTELLRTLRDDQLSDVVATFGGDIGNLAKQMQSGVQFETQFAKIRQDNVSAEIDLLKEQIATAKEAQSQWSKTAQSISAYRASLLTSDMSPLSPEQKLDAAFQAYSKAITAAQEGDIDAAGKVNDLAKTYLDQAKAYYASSEGYAEIFQGVQDSLGDVETVASIQAKEATKSLATLNKQLSVQEDMLKALQVVPSDIAAILKGINSGNSSEILKWSTTQDGGTQAQVKRAVLESYTNAQIEAAFGGFSDIQAARANDPSFNLAAWFKAYGIGEVLAGTRSIPGFATGTDSAPPGMAWVGEQGRELVQMAGGERVYPHSVSMDIARSWGAANDRWGGNVVPFRGQSGGSGGVTVDFRGMERRLDDAVDLLKALVYENSELKTVNKKQAAELSKLRTEAADRDARPRRTGTYGQ